MAMKIKSSPKLRDRKPESAKEPEHRFVVSDSSDSDKPGRVGATTILKVGIGAIVLLVGSLAIFSAMEGPDPHYLTARKLVHDYEFGKPVESRNYDHRIYGDALEELDLVDPRSKSAEAADALRIEIERGMTEFRDRQAAIEDGLKQARVKNGRRKAIEFEARERNRNFPRVEFPECDEEELGGHEEKGHVHAKNGASR
jgi:hypothetical protein